MNINYVYRLPCKSSSLRSISFVCQCIDRVFKVHDLCACACVCVCVSHWRQPQERLALHGVIPPDVQTVLCLWPTSVNFQAWHVATTCLYNRFYYGSSSFHASLNTAAVHSSLICTVFVCNQNIFNLQCWVCLHVTYFCLYLDRCLSSCTIHLVCLSLCVYLSVRVCLSWALNIDCYIATVH